MPPSRTGTSAALFYLAAYTFMVAGSFGVVTLVGRRGDGHHDLKDYNGLSRAEPVLAACFTLFLLAQAGVPFTAGFMAKFGVIGAAADRHSWTLAVIAMVSAVISAYLYLRIVVSMYFGADDTERRDSIATADPHQPGGEAGTDDRGGRHARAGDRPRGVRAPRARRRRAARRVPLTAHATPPRHPDVGGAV